MGKSEVQKTIRVAKDTPSTFKKRKDGKMPRVIAPLMQIFGSQFYAETPSRWPNEEIKDNRERLQETSAVFEEKAKNAEQSAKKAEADFDDYFQVLQDTVEAMLSASRRLGRAQAFHQNTVDNGAPQDAQDAAEADMDEIELEYNALFEEFQGQVAKYGDLQEVYKNETRKHGMMAGMEAGFSLASRIGVFVNARDPSHPEAKKKIEE